MVIFSISFGLIPAIPLAKISLKSPALIRPFSILGILRCKGTPSTTHKGSASPVSVFVPRIRIFADSPGRPDLATILTPATCPCNNWSIDVGTLFSNTSLPTTATEPVVRFWVVCVYPVETITSSNCPTAIFNTTFTCVSVAPNLTSCVSIPIKENCKTWYPSGISKTKFPVASVETPIVVPLIITVTPGNGAPSSSFTLPLITLNFCSDDSCGAFSNKIIRSWIR